MATPSTHTQSPWRLLSIVGSVALGCGALAVYAAGGSSVADETVEHKSSPQWQARTQLPIAFREASGPPCSFAPGTRMAYAVHTRTSLELDMEGVSSHVKLGGAGSPSQASVRSSEATQRDIERDWLLELEAVAPADEGGTILAARIQDRGTRDLLGGSAPQPSAQLSDTFLIRIDARCSIHEFGWRTGGDLSAAREQQVMAAGLGFWAPRDLSEAVAYGAKSFDMSGSYEASYAYDERGQIRGQIVSYAAPQTPLTRPSLRFDDVESPKDPLSRPPLLR